MKTPPPPDIRIITSPSGKMNFEREFHPHDVYFPLQMLNVQENILKSMHFNSMANNVIISGGQERNNFKKATFPVIIMCTTLACSMFNV